MSSEKLKDYQAAIRIVINQAHNNVLTDRTGGQEELIETEWAIHTLNTPDLPDLDEAKDHYWQTAYTPHKGEQA